MSYLVMVCHASSWDYNEGGVDESRRVDNRPTPRPRRLASRPTSATPLLPSPVWTVRVCQPAARAGAGRGGFHQARDGDDRVVRRAALWLLLLLLLLLLLYDRARREIDRRIAMESRIRVARHSHTRPSLTTTNNPTPPPPRTTQTEGTVILSHGRAESRSFCESTAVLRNGRSERLRRKE